MVKPSVFVRLGSSTELTCKYDTHAASEGFILEWRYAAPGTPVVQAKRVLFYNGKLYREKSWEGRMALVQNPPVSGVASVRIISADMFDTGLYICVVTNPNDWSNSTQGLISLTVLAPPSVPECGLQVDTFVGNDVTLICRSFQTGLPTPVYSRHREQNAAPLPPDSFVEDQHTGSLMLHNLSDAFTRTYICKVSNELSQAECSITLSVTCADVINGVLMEPWSLLIVLLIGVTLTYVGWKRDDQKTSEHEAGEKQLSTSSEERRESTTLSVEY